MNIGTFKLEKRLKFFLFLKKIATTLFINDYMLRIFDHCTVTDCVQAFDRRFDLLTQIMTLLDHTSVLIKNLNDISLTAA